MDFKFTDEQEQLRDTLLRFVQKEYGFEQRREIIHARDGFSRAIWKQFAEMGLLALGLPEEHDGLGGTAVDTLVVMETLGRGMVVEPYLSTVVLSAGLIARAGKEAQQAELLPKVASGELLLAFAHYEPNARYELAHVTTRARRDGDDYVLSGNKNVVLHGGSADGFIVSARTSGKDADENGLSLFFVDAKAPGLTVQGYMTHDGQRAADIAFKDVKVAPSARICDEGEAFGEIERTIEHGIAALCAEAVGNMSALQELTLTYLKTRKQFGVPIGAFQVLQHRMADMVMQTEQARSMAYLAACKVDLDDAHERRRAIAAAKAFVGQAARFVGQQAVQLHGGIGVADEFAAGHYFKRLTLINATFGDADWHLGRFSDLIAAGQMKGDAKPALVKRA